MARYQIVGVVKNALHYGAREQPCGGRVASFQIDRAAPGGSFFVRGSLPIGDIVRIASEEARAADSEIFVERVRLLQADVNAMIASERLVGLLASALALIALVLADLGLYGIVSYGVTQRTGEIGLRAALGATPGLLSRMVLPDAGRIIVVGLTLGIAVRLVRYPSDRGPVVRCQPFGPCLMIALAALTLGFIAIGAAYLPARRAARIDPAVALRVE